MHRGALAPLQPGPGVTNRPYNTNITFCSLLLWKIDHFQQAFLFGGNFSFVSGNCGQLWGTHPARGACRRIQEQWFEQVLSTATCPCLEKAEPRTRRASGGTQSSFPRGPQSCSAHSCPQSKNPRLRWATTPQHCSSEQKQQKTQIPREIKQSFWKIHHQSGCCPDFLRFSEPSDACILVMNFLTRFL